MEVGQRKNKNVGFRQKLVLCARWVFQKANGGDAVVLVNAESEVRKNAHEEYVHHAVHGGVLGGAGNDVVVVIPTCPRSLLAAVAVVARAPDGARARGLADGLMELLYQAEAARVGGGACRGPRGGMTAKGPSRIICISGGGLSRRRSENQFSGLRCELVPFIVGVHILVEWGLHSRASQELVDESRVTQAQLVRIELNELTNL